VGAGVPVVATWRVPGVPTKKVDELALVMTGALGVVVPDVVGAGADGSGLPAVWLVAPETDESGALTHNVLTV
jgi:hypothetical protein